MGRRQVVRAGRAVRAGRKQIPRELLPWFEARRRFKLSPAHTQMARELGMNPRKLGSLANESEEPWKLPLPEFIPNATVSALADNSQSMCDHWKKWCRQKSRGEKRKKRARPENKNIVLLQVNQLELPDKK